MDGGVFLWLLWGRKPTDRFESQNGENGRSPETGRPAGFDPKPSFEGAPHFPISTRYRPAAFAAASIHVAMF